MLGFWSTFKPVGEPKLVDLAIASFLLSSKAIWIIVNVKYYSHFLYFPNLMQTCNRMSSPLRASCSFSHSSRDKASATKYVLIIKNKLIKRQTLQLHFLLAQWTRPCLLKLRIYRTTGSIDCAMPTSPGPTAFRWDSVSVWVILHESFSGKHETSALIFEFFFVRQQSDHLLGFCPYIQTLIAVVFNVLEVLKFIVLFDFKNPN